MPPIARLTWQAADPARLAGTLGAQLGLRPVPDRGGFAVPLRSATLELVPWRPEHPSDAPTEGGRLVFEPAWDPSELSTVAPGPDDALHLLAVGWSTVELDRAEADLEMWLAATGRSPEARRDPHLGATVRLRDAPELPGARLALAEPDTEGRLAASLARDGEGPCVLYVAPREGIAAWRASARARGTVLARRETGPLGPQLLVVGGPVAGPHLIVVDPEPHSSPARGAVTIAP